MHVPKEAQSTQPPAEAPTSYPLPTLPESKEDKLNCDIRRLMRDILPWARQALVQRLRDDEAFNQQFIEKEFWQERPLQIAATTGSSDKALVGFKPAWSREQCVTAIETRGMYEASMNVDWLMTFSCEADNHIIAGDPVTYEDIETICTNVMTIHPDVLASAQSADDVPKDQRRYFSFVLACYTPNAAYLDREAFQHELVLLDGHAFVWAWYLHLYNLLQAPASSRSGTIALRHHLDMGLSATAQVRVESDPAKLALWSAERAGSKEFIGHMGADSFPSFVRKTSLILKDVPCKKRLEHLQALNVMYEGTVVNHKMYYAMHAVAPVIEGPASETLTAIQNEFGKKAVAKGYTKLYNISRLCQKVAAKCGDEAGLSAVDMFNWVLEGILFELRHELLAVANMKEHLLTGTKTSNGKAGVLLWKLLLWRYLKGLLRDAADAGNEGMKQEVDDLISKFDSFESFGESFQNTSSEELESDFIRWKKDKKKIVREIADLVHDLFGGVHNAALDALLLDTHASPLTVDWASGDIIAPCAGIVRSLRASASTIPSTVAENAPTQPIRGLHRMKSDPVYEDARKADVDKERNEIWRQAVEERKKLVTFVSCSNWTEAGLNQMVSQLKACQAFKPIVGESHRVFHASADLMGQETSKTPWAVDVESNDVLMTTFKAAMRPSGPADVSVVFDGGSRAARRDMEDIVEENKWCYCSEIALTYKAPKKPPTGGRLNLFSRKNWETGFVQSRFSSNRWIVKERTDFNVGGEEDSYDASYSGIARRSRFSLPLMAADERDIIVGDSPSPAAGMFDVSERGHPFAWQEKKPIAWYARFLDDISAGLVLDFTPGSGALARACLEEGTQYIGITKKPEHASWLTNVLNRASVECTTRSGTALYEQTLADCLKDHFKELIEELHAQDAGLTDDEDNE